ncbi:MAG TPA: GNAT family N-acetyltransferase [Pyrinomonadaceae bacterium]|nr:GNAT family N-acetyltransferase [Pyrinomonadaceae bacterium]
MTIRRATPEEAAALTQIALDAKRYWGYPEHWIQHWESDLAVSSDFIREHHVYIAEDDGEIRGFYALCVSDNKAELEHMWVTPNSIGTGVGKELFLDAMERAAALSVDAVELSADPNAAGFYSRMGATQIGETDSVIDGQVRKLPRMTIEPSTKGTKETKGT